MRNKIIIILIITIVALISTTTFMSIRINDLNRDLSISSNNVKAYAMLHDSLNSSNRLFQLRIADMEYLNDSIFNQMLKQAEELDIKEKNIKQLQYQLENYSRVETIYITQRDTIFKEPDFVLDTCMSDKWGKTCLSLRAPNVITVGHSYINKKHIIMSTKKEPVKQRKWFLPRWFTKKHTVVDITVVDENPYIETKESRFVEIIK